MKRTFACVLALSCHLTMHAQITLPPLPPSPPVTTNYYVVAAVTAAGVSRPSNEVSSTNWPVLLTWNPSPTPGAKYIVEWGTRSGVHPHHVDAGPGTHFVLSQLPPPPPAIPPVLSLQTSTDLLHWTTLLCITGNLAEPARQYRLKISP